MRCRPLPDAVEGVSASQLALKMIKNTVIVESHAAHGMASAPQNSQQQSFTFDRAFWSVPTHTSLNGYATQECVYRDIGRPVLLNSLKGYNCCLLAYGQTGSGKSYSMFGSETASPSYTAAAARRLRSSHGRRSQPPQDDGRNGIVPQIVRELFDRIQTRPDIHFTVEISFYQIYLEKATCLLNPKQGVLKVREHPLTGPYVEDLTSCLCDTRKSMMKVIQEGNRSRKIGQTKQNAVSSRSHAVIAITISQQAKSSQSTTTVSKLSLVDLAGSERISKSGSVGTGVQEASTINKSLSTLGKVISVLAGKAYKKNRSSVHVPYRDSALTWLLRESLGGNSKTVMLATVSSSAADREESLSTLKYADQAKRIVNKATINEGSTKKIVQQLKSEITFLQEQLYKGADVTLQQKLLQSQKLRDQMTRTWDEKWSSTQQLLREKEHQAQVLQQENKSMTAELKRMEEELERAQVAQAEVAKVKREVQRLQTELLDKHEEVAALTGRNSSLSSAMTSADHSSASTPPTTPRDPPAVGGGGGAPGRFRAPSSTFTGAARGPSPLGGRVRPRTPSAGGRPLPRSSAVLPSSSAGGGYTGRSRVLDDDSQSTSSSSSSSLTESQFTADSFSDLGAVRLGLVGRGRRSGSGSDSAVGPPRPSPFATRGRSSSESTHARSPPRRESGGGTAAAATAAASSSATSITSAATVTRANSFFDMPRPGSPLLSRDSSAGTPSATAAAATSATARGRMGASPSPVAGGASSANGGGGAGGGDRDRGGPQQQQQAPSTFSSSSVLAAHPYASSIVRGDRAATATTTTTAAAATAGAPTPRDGDAREQEREEDVRWKRWLENKKSGRASPLLGATASATSSTAAPALSSSSASLPVSVSVAASASAASAASAPAAAAAAAAATAAAPAAKYAGRYRAPSPGIGVLRDSRVMAAGATTAALSAGNGSGSNSSSTRPSTQPVIARGGGGGGGGSSGRDRRRAAAPAQSGSRASAGAAAAAADASFSSDDSNGDPERAAIERETLENTKEAIRLSDVARKRIDDDYRRLMLGLQPVQQKARQANGRTASAAAAAAAAQQRSVTFSNSPAQHIG